MNNMNEERMMMLALDASPRRVPMVYVSYPYSDNPMQRVNEVQGLVFGLLELSKAWVPIVPHFCFDALFDFPVGYEHAEVGVWELELISHCNILIYDPAQWSSGVHWERTFAQRIGLLVMSVDQFKEYLTKSKGAKLVT